MSNIPFNELCALEPYIETRNDRYSILRDISIARAGQICSACPLRVECNPNIVKDKSLYLVTDQNGSN